MAAFEDFVNSNLGIRQPFISDFAPPTGQGKSLKAAGIRGSKFLDLSTNFLYEKTGENNNVDWSKIAELGEPRGGAAANLTGEQYIQFVSGSSLVGSENFIYDYGQQLVSGISGYYQDIDGISGHLTNELIVGELENDTFVTMADGEVDINGNVSVGGNLRNSFVPKYGLDITLGSSFSKRGSSDLSVSRVSAGHYRVIFQFAAYTNLESYQVVASISNIPGSSWGMDAGDPRANIEIVRELNRIDLYISSEAGTLIDFGIVTILVYEF